MLHTILNDMFHLQLPFLEKLLRPILVYLVLVALLRIFGKRELAQLNPFDLVVLLSLSNTVQNAIIGDDNSVSGGVIGAVALLTINWLVARMLFKYPKLNRTLQGRSTILVKNGKVDNKALDHESLTHQELMEVLHKQGFESLRQVKLCQLDPNGTFYVEALEPGTAEQQHTEVMARLEELTKEVAALRRQSA